jgi:hypothetical protein
MARAETLVQPEGNARVPRSAAVAVQGPMGAGGEARWSHICATRGRPFAWRQRWAGCWECVLLLPALPGALRAALSREVSDAW